MATFEDGWICQKCWSANRDSDSRCYRCRSEPSGYAAYQAKSSIPTAPVPTPAPAPPILPPAPAQIQEAVDSLPPQRLPKTATPMPRLTMPSLPRISVLGGVRSMFGRIANAGRSVGVAWSDTRRRAAAMRRRAGMFTFWVSAMVLCWLVIFFEFAPGSAGGRLVASVLAMLGLGLFSAATAAVTSSALAERHGSKGAGKAHEG